MAHQDGADKGASGIARVGKRKWGYDPDQVDAFLDRAHALYESEDAHLTQQDIQNVSFDLSKGGYDITQVDAALSRLEQAVVDKQTTREITEHGRVAWKAQTEELYRQVCEHADRGTGERFARGHDRRPSYDRKQVDRLIDQIVDKAAAGLGVDGVSEQDVRKLADLNSGAVSNVVFTQRKGKNGYDERQVDYYLNSCVQLLSRLESFARVSDYVGGGHESGGSRRSSGARSASDAGVTPLFGADNAYAHAPSPARQEAEPQSFAPANESFHALHEAEEALFSSQTADEPSVAADAQSVPPSFAPAGMSGTVVSAPASALPSAFSAGASAPEPQSSLAALSQRTGRSVSSSNVSADHAAAPAPAPEIPSPAIPAVPASFAPSYAAVSDQPAAVAEPQAPERVAKSVKVSAEPVAAAPTVAPSAPAPMPVFDQPVASDAHTDASVEALPSFAPSSSPSANVPVHVVDDAAQTQSDDSHKSSSDDLFSSMYLSPESKLDFDIPDLSFPTLNTGEFYSGLSGFGKDND